MQATPITGMPTSLMWLMRGFVPGGGFGDLANVNDHDVALVDPARKGDTSNENCHNVLRREFLAIMEPVLPAEMQLHAETEIKTRPRLAMLFMEWVHPFGVLQMSKHETDLVRRRATCNEAPDAVAEIFDMTLDDAV